MVSYILRMTPRSYKKIALEKVTSLMSMISETKTLHLEGQKLSYRLEVVVTGRRLVAE